MALADDEMPAGIREIRDYVAQTFNGGDTRDIWVNTHDHEQLSPGAYSIALEGPYEWPYAYQEAKYEGKAPDPEGWQVQTMTGWCLAVYPEKSPEQEAEEWDDMIWARPAYME